MTKLTLRDYEITVSGDLAAGHIKVDAVQRSEPRKAFDIGNRWKPKRPLFVCFV